MKNWETRWPNKTPWTHAQIARLRELRGQGAFFDLIAREVGHTPFACQSKAVQLGIRAPRRAGAKWTHAQIARLHELRGQGATFEEIAIEVGRTVSACQTKAMDLGIRVPRGRPPMQKCIPTVQKPEAPRHHQPWTKEEEQRLLALSTHASRLSYAEIGARLNRTAVSVEVRLKALSRGVVGAKKSEGSRRPCLCCRRQFNSQGPGNRLCKNCRTTSVSPFEI